MSISKQKIFFFFGLCFLLTALLAGSPNNVFAANPKPVIRDSGYSASFVSQSVIDPVEIEAGSTKTVIIKFKNTGTATWKANGAGFVSAYTVEPRGRVSVFSGSQWISGKQTNTIAKDVKPNGTAELVLTLNAPKTAGAYKEEFYLASENQSWINGGYFFLTINVKPKPAYLMESKPPKSEAKANKFIQTKESVEVKGGEIIDLVVGFQNMGKNEWKSYGLALKESSSVANDIARVSYADGSWKNPSIIFEKEAVVQPEGVVRENIRLRAPRTAGAYVAEFNLEVDGDPIQDTEVNLNINVTENAPEYYVEPFQENTSGEIVSPVSSSSYSFAEEPRIRVGIWKPAEFAQFWSDDAPYDVYDGETKIGVLPPHKLGVLNYENGIYSFRGGDMDFTTSKYIRLSPVDNEHAVFKLLNFERFVKWKGPQNFNSYRGALEYRVTQDGNTVYAINELLLEDYVRGIGENSNSSPSEYLKAQTVAQRTYAYYVMAFSGKHNERNFDVVAHTGDQLYLGYESEMIMPRFVEAANATRGEMATYENNIVITPYFGNSNGRTKSWTEVWGGNTKPWLVSVKTEYDKARGRRQSGHGVGMSQIDASIRADKEGIGHIDILKHYYTGIAIERMYE